MSQSSPNTEANTTNTSTSNTTVRDIGLTGEQAVRALGYISSTTASTLQGLTEASIANNAGAYSLVQGLAREQSSSLGALINATQDFGQRAIAAGTGQPTPIQQLGPAAGKQIPVWVWFALAGMGALALFRG